MLPSWAAAAAEQLQRQLHLSPDNQLHQQLLRLWCSHLAPRTIRSYDSKLRKYFTFCAEQQLLPFPAQPVTMMLYITWLQQQGDVHPNSFPQYLAAINTLHRDLLFEVPAHPMLRALTRAAARAAVQAGSVAEHRGPLPARVAARTLALAVERSTEPVLCLACVAVLIAFHTGIRGASVMAMLVSDLSFSPETRSWQISVWDEKGRAHLGRRRAIPCYCDYPELFVLLYTLHAALPPASKLFAALGAATETAFGSVVQRVLTALGESPPAGLKWLGHSCRSGMASACAALGVSYPRIMERGGWHSDAILLYIFNSIVDDAYALAFFGFLLPGGQRTAAQLVHPLVPLQALT